MMAISVFFHLSTVGGHTTNAQQLDGITNVRRPGVQQVWTVQEICMLEIGDTVKRGVLALDINSLDL